METITMKNCTGKLFYLNRGTNVMDLEKFKIYVNCADNFLEFFGEGIIKMALLASDSRFTEFAKIVEASDAEANMYVKMGYYLGSGPKTIEREVYKGEWHKTEKIKGYTVWIKNEYQDNSKIFRNAMLLKYPWLGKFPGLVFYKTCFGDLEKEIFYLNCGKITGPGRYGDKMLYIYMRDFITGNFVKCMEGHINYYKGYYKWPGGWGRGVTEEMVMDWRAENCSIATTPEALRFYGEMELNRLREQGIKC